MRRAILVVVALSCAPSRAAVLTRVPSAPVPVLRGFLAAPTLGTNLGPMLLAAPLAAPTLAPSLIAPQLPAAPMVQTQQVLADIPVIDLVPAAQAPAPVTLASLVSFAGSLSRLASDDPKPALDAFWTGPQARSAAVEAAGPSYLATPRDADFLQLGSIVASAQGSPTGRKVLKAVLALAKAEGKPIQVRFHDLKGNLGEYDYIDRVLYLDRSYADGELSLGAATLVHELLHILQHAEGVPSEALEMELEAHVVTLMVLDELGVPASRDGSFSAAAARELRKSPEAFEEWLAGQLPGKLRMNKGLAAATESLEEEQEDLQGTIEDLEEAYARLGTAQAKGRLAKAQDRLGAVRADLKRLKSSAGRAAYRKLAARARALMERYHRALAGRK